MPRLHLVDESLHHFLALEKVGRNAHFRRRKHGVEQVVDVDELLLVRIDERFGSDVCVDYGFDLREAIQRRCTVPTKMCM